MSKETQIPELNVGVVGHIDHGKTTLLSKLTGKFTDTHSEELKRGITIKLGYAETIICKDKEPVGYNNEGKGTPVRYISFIDAAILVIAANEGIKPQTQEHFVALQAKNLKNIIIVQNKIDLVSKEQALENYRAIKAFVKGTIAEHAPIIPVSAQQNINIDKIFEALALLEIPKKDPLGKPVFLIARSFDINRPGTLIENLKGGVLGGILKHGTLKVGDEIEIKPGISMKKANQIVYKTLTAKIISLHKGSSTVKEAFPGSKIG